MLKLFLISQTEVRGYDVYQSAVVVAETYEGAKIIHPDGKGKNPFKNYGDWASSIDSVKVEYLGELSPFSLYEAGSVVCSDFTAG